MTLTQKKLIECIRKVHIKIRRQDKEQAIKAATRETLDTAIAERTGQGEPGQAGLLYELLEINARLAKRRFDNFYEEITDLRTGVRVGTTLGVGVGAGGAGATAAAIVGGCVGSAIFPGPGTIFGVVVAGAVGGIIGLVTGSLVGNEVGKKINKELDD